MPIHLTCETCGKPFSVPPSHRSETRGRFCSRACDHVAKRQPFTAERFWAKVDRPDEGCWEWQGARTKHGYGRLFVRNDEGGRDARYAHRIAYELTYGPIPEGKSVLHGCDNPPCCRPDHFRLGDQRDNNADRDTRGRTHRGERTGGAKLNDRQVTEIRSLASQGVLSNSAIARAYEVSHSTVDDVVARRTWTHLP